MLGQRYKAFRAGLTGHWTIFDRNRNVYLFWAWAEDEEAANALARAFNTIDRLALRSSCGGFVEAPQHGGTPARPETDHSLHNPEKAERVRLSLLMWRNTNGRFGMGEGPPAAAQYRPRSQGAKLSEYAAKAPESERRLIAKLRAAGD